MKCSFRLKVCNQVKQLECVFRRRGLKLFVLLLLWLMLLKLLLLLLLPRLPFE